MIAKFSLKIPQKSTSKSSVLQSDVFCGLPASPVVLHPGPSEQREKRRLPRVEEAVGNSQPRSRRLFEHDCLFEAAQDLQTHSSLILSLRRLPA